jgi:hypothetical protein
VAISGIGLSSWLIAGTRNVRLVQRDVLAELREEHLPRSESSPAIDTEALVWAPGMTRLHRATCPLVAGKAMRVISVGEVADLGLRACGVCQP